ncbi:unnamed protein product [Thelazia callipaeda]|uniref:Uncharacterized protein n=1 Tax=Thelazia callipaeda TaxID=103827 RepID=A0A0N5CXF5_THECL|nr:unnamed protein product [Thelazia callipaeda]
MITVAVFADRYDSQASFGSSASSSYLRKLINRNDVAREREVIPRIMKIYHYDNLTDCEAVCEIPCGTTYVIRNDVDERRQFICTQRKVPAVSAFITFSNTGIIPIIMLIALILFGLLLITCCCCMRCGCGCGCCRKACQSSNSSNDPLVNGEFREVLDSKDIGYLKKETARKIVTV